MCIQQTLVSSQRPSFFLLFFWDHDDDDDGDRTVNHPRLVSAGLQYCHVKKRPTMNTTTPLTFMHTFPCFYKSYSFLEKIAQGYKSGSVPFPTFIVAQTAAMFNLWREVLLQKKKFFVRLRTPWRLDPGAISNSNSHITALVVRNSRHDQSLQFFSSWNGVSLHGFIFSVCFPYFEQGNYIRLSTKWAFLGWTFKWECFNVNDSRQNMIERGKLIEKEWLSSSPPLPIKHWVKMSK